MMNLLTIIVLLFLRLQSNDAAAWKREIEIPIGLSLKTSHQLSFAKVDQNVGIIGSPPSSGINIPIAAPSVAVPSPVTPALTVASTTIPAVLSAVSTKTLFGTSSTVLTTKSLVPASVLATEIMTSTTSSSTTTISVVTTTTTSGSTKKTTISDSPTTESQTAITITPNKETSSVTTEKPTSEMTTATTSTTGTIPLLFKLTTSKELFPSLVKSQEKKQDNKPLIGSIQPTLSETAKKKQSSADLLKKGQKNIVKAPDNSGKTNPTKDKAPGNPGKTNSPKGKAPGNPGKATLPEEKTLAEQTFIQPLPPVDQLPHTCGTCIVEGSTGFESIMQRILPGRNGLLPHKGDGFGAKKNRKKTHKGVDFNYVGGQSGINMQHPGVYAPVTGKVYYVGGVYGTVKIKTTDGISHEILHLERAFVKQGQEIKAGDLLGRMGGRGPERKVGNQTRPAGPKAYDQHIHIQLRKPDGKYGDPVKIYKENSYP